MIPDQQILGDVHGRWFTRYVYEARDEGGIVRAWVDCDPEAETPQTSFFWLVVEAGKDWQPWLYGQKPTAEEAKEDALKSLAWYMQARADKRVKPHEPHEPHVPPRRKAATTTALGILGWLGRRP